MTWRKDDPRSLPAHVTTLLRGGDRVLVGASAGAMFSLRPDRGEPMLDAFIIDRIRREREREQREDGAFVPLRIDVPRPQHPIDREEIEEEESPRGSVVIDFHV